MSIGAQELFVILLLGVILIGPRDLPLLIKFVRAIVVKVRSLAAEFQMMLDEIVASAEVEDLKKEMGTLEKELATKTDFKNQIGQITSQLEGDFEDDLEGELRGKKASNKISNKISKRAAEQAAKQASKRLAKKPEKKPTKKPTKKLEKQARVPKASAGKISKSAGKISTSAGKTSKSAGKRAGLS